MRIENGIETTMRTMIREWGRGTIFFLDDFAIINDPVSVRQFICSLVDDGYVIRLARGIYCYPRLSTEGYVTKMVIPSADTIAYALAGKENVRIIPYGDQAAVRLGLSDLVVSSHRYLTDGSPRIINLSATEKIYFNHTSEMKMFAFCNESMQMLASAIRAFGAEWCTGQEIRRKVREILKQVPEKEFYKDVTLPPAWVGKIILSLWG